MEKILLPDDHIIAVTDRTSDIRVVEVDIVKRRQVNPEGLDIGYLKTYEEAEKGKALCLKGSLGLLEISIREGSAAAWLEASVGDGILLSAVSGT